VNIPNLISLGRLIAVPVIVWLILKGRMTEAFWLFVAAGVSDAVDGFIAKRFSATTVLGGYLDPLADKVLLVGVYIALGQTGWLDDWLVIMVVFRDILILGGALLFHLTTQSLSMRPIFISKVNTVCQIGLAASILGATGLGFSLGIVRDALIYIVAATTLVSGAVYVVTWSRQAAAMEDQT
jgi:cardiolipin synthase